MTKLPNCILGRNQHSNFLHVYFNFAYYFLIAPFRFRRVGQGQYELSEWLPQKIFCGMASALAFLPMGTSIRVYLADVKKNDPVSFFLVFYYCAYLIFYAVLVRGVWTKKQVYLRLINSLRNDKLLPYNPWKLESVWTLGLIFTSFVIVALSSCFFQIGFLPNGDWSLEFWLRLQLSQARTVFFLASGTEHDPDPHDNPDWTCMNIVLTSLTVLSSLSLYLLGYFVEPLVLMHVWTLWSATSGFTAALLDERVERGNGNENDANFKVGRRQGMEAKLEQFEALKCLSSLIDQTVGDSLLFYVGQTSLFYAICFGDLILVESRVRRVALILLYAVYLSSLIFSAEIVRKMGWFKSWLYEQGRWRQLDRGRLKVLLNELADHRVGITASGIFTFNYGFVGTVVSVLITYFIIRLQSMPKD